ncbi:hypothetical protein TNCV_1778961 [Trichonephila clavipes]|nr:hypothetical protein TNCV_1778961 [Trichonephila clavipes]
MTPPPPGQPIGVTILSSQHPIREQSLRSHPRKNSIFRNFRKMPSIATPPDQSSPPIVVKYTPDRETPLSSIPHHRQSDMGWRAAHMSKDAPYASKLQSHMALKWRSPAHAL